MSSDDMKKQYVRNFLELFYTPNYFTAEHLGLTKEEAEEFNKDYLVPYGQSDEFLENIIELKEKYLEDKEKKRKWLVFKDHIKAGIALNLLTQSQYDRLDSITDFDLVCKYLEDIDKGIQTLYPVEKINV